MAAGSKFLAGFIENLNIFDKINFSKFFSTNCLLMSYKLSPKFTRKTKKTVDKLLIHVYSQGKKKLCLL